MTRLSAVPIRTDRAAPTLLLTPGPIPSGQSIGIDDGKPGRKPGLVSSDADQAGEFAELFRAVYLTFHRRDGPRSQLPNASLAVLEHLALAGPLTIGEAAAHLSRAPSVVSEIVSHLGRVPWMSSGGASGALRPGWLVVGYVGNSHSSAVMLLSR